jgi:prevent-host-death family protein
MSRPVLYESIRDARQHLVELVYRAEYEGKTIVLTRHGREIAAIVPIEFLRGMPDGLGEHGPVPAAADCHG